MIGLLPPMLLALVNTLFCIPMMNGFNKTSTYRFWNSAGAIDVHFLSRHSWFEIKGLLAVFDGEIMIFTEWATKMIRALDRTRFTE